MTLSNEAMNLPPSVMPLPLLLLLDMHDFLTAAVAWQSPVSRGREPKGLAGTQLVAP